MAMICVQLLTFAAAITELMPTLPTPKTASDEPDSGSRAFITAPAPVWMPHPSGPTTSRGTSSSTLTTLRSLAIEYSAQEDWAKKQPLTRSPSCESGEVPSPTRSPRKLCCRPSRGPCDRPRPRRPGPAPRRCGADRPVRPSPVGALYPPRGRVLPGFPWYSFARVSVSHLELTASRRRCRGRGGGDRHPPRRARGTPGGPRGRPGGHTPRQSPPRVRGATVPGGPRHPAR